MTSWNDTNTAELWRLRREGLSFSQIADRLNVSRNSALGRWHRSKDGNEPKNKATTRERVVFSPNHLFKEIKPAARPDEPDSSTPKFARHDQHVRAALLLGGFVALRREARA